MNDTAKLISNFHTHTQLCQHAVGRPLDYVKAAIKDGCSELGFSDHCPYPDNPWNNWGGSRMRLEQVSEYVNDVKEASALADFKVHLGFECEYDKNYVNWYKDELLGKIGAEYLVFGPHWVTVGHDHPYIPEINHDKKLLYKYTDQTIEGIQSGIYSFIAHPDLFMLGWKEWDSDAESCLRNILECAKDQGLPVEINGAGINRGLFSTSRGPRYGYPYDEFWKMAAASGVKVICNSDAHFPEHVIKNAILARSYAEKSGIVPIETIF